MKTERTYQLSGRARVLLQVWRAMSALSGLSFVLMLVTGLRAGDGYFLAAPIALLADVFLQVVATSALLRSRTWGGKAMQVASVVNVIKSIAGLVFVATILLTTMQATETEVGISAGLAVVSLAWIALWIRVLVWLRAR